MTRSHTIIHSRAALSVASGPFGDLKESLCGLRIKLFWPTGIKKADADGNLLQNLVFFLIFFRFNRKKDEKDLKMGNIKYTFLIFS